jgi:hypothetical protein
MTTIDKNIIETYSGLFQGLSPLNKIELIEKLVKSLKLDSKSKEKEFFKSFGAFASDKPAEEIVSEIRDSRKFRDKEIKF